jgi:hypothetical protein
MKVATKTLPGYCSTQEHTAPKSLAGFLHYAIIFAGNPVLNSNSPTHEFCI